MQQVGDLELNQDLDFQRASWTVQRIGRAIMVLVTLAALAGVFGRGPLSRATAGDESALLQIKYNRFERRHGPTQMEIQVGQGAIQGDTIRLWVDREYLQGNQVESVVPEPDSMEARPDRMIYVFKVNQPGAGTTITFNMNPQQIGPRTVRVGLDNGQELSFRQFVYP